MTKGQTGGTRSTTTVRVLPTLTRQLLSASLVLAGPITIVLVVAAGLWLLMPLCLLPVVAGVRLIGWAEIDAEKLSHHRLLGASESVQFSEVREVGLGMDQTSRGKWWYPEVESANGQSLKFLMLKSRSGKRTVAKVEEVFTACMEHMPDASSDPFSTVTTSEDGELEFFLSPGYDSYLREKAEGSSALEATTPEPVRVPQAPPKSARLPHETFCEPALDSKSDEPTPEVFTPRALTDRRQSESHLTVVHDSFVTRAEEDRRLAPAGMLPPVVIEQPAVIPEQPKTTVKTERQFTSLFRRTS